MGFFIGKEAEGIYKGLFTLFVIGEEPWGSIIAHAAQYQVHQIYLGARGSDSSRIASEGLGYCDCYQITLETDDISKIPSDVIGHIRIILKIRSADISILDALDMIKLDTGKNCFIIPKGQMLKNEVLYQDKEVV